MQGFLAFFTEFKKLNKITSTERANSNRKETYTIGCTHPPNRQKNILQLNNLAFQKIKTVLGVCFCYDAKIIQCFVLDLLIWILKEIINETQTESAIKPLMYFPTFSLIKGIHHVFII